VNAARDDIYAEELGEGEGEEAALKALL